MGSIVGGSCGVRPPAEGREAMAPLRWSMFQQALRRHALMDEMMETSGVDPIAAVRTGEGFVAARATCRECTHDDGCRTWFLEGGDALGQPAEFCPNAELRLKTRGPEPSHSRVNCYAPAPGGSRRLPAPSPILRRLRRAPDWPSPSRRHDMAVFRVGHGNGEGVARRLRLLVEGHERGLQHPVSAPYIGSCLAPRSQIPCRAPRGFTVRLPRR